MSHNFVEGDVVAIGNGKVEYTVSALNADGTLELKGEKSKRKGVDAQKVRMITAWNDLTPPNVESVEGVTYPIAAWEVELLATHGKRFSLVLNDTIVGYKSFEAAAFALSRAKGTYTHASIDDHNKGKRVSVRVAA